MPAEPHLDHRMRRECATRLHERGIAELAGRQHGVVGRGQLLALGFSLRAVDRRIEQGRLNVVHVGVYAVGHRVISAHGHWMAAVLAGGTGSVLSHASAAALWDLHRSRGAVDVIASAHRRSRPGLRFHQTSLAPDEITVRDSIPVTTVARTLFDLAAVVPRHRLEAAINEAERRGLSDAASVPELVARYPGRRGVASLRAILAAGRIGLTLPASELEERFLAFLDRRGLPRPEVNAGLEVGGLWLKVDCLWRSQGLIVELDGHAFHADPAAYERDRARDRVLIAAGWRIARVTWRQLHVEPERLAGDLRSALAARGAH
jgi:hypothetical protein